MVGFVYAGLEPKSRHAGGGGGGMFVNERGMLAPALTIAVSLPLRCPLPRQTEGEGSCF